jgi:hypothetical protein
MPAIRRAAVFSAALVAIAVAPASPAPAAHHRHHQAARPTYAPPRHHAYHGVTGTTNLVPDFRAFRVETGSHPAVIEVFYHWGTPLDPVALPGVAQTDTRGVVSLSTAPGGGSELITPAQIAAGRGDDYILKLKREIAASGQVVYLRLFPEMNGSWNPYSAFDASGAPRPGHSTHQFKQAWRRIVTIMRGGRRGEINRNLRRLGMPRILRAGSNRAPVYRRLGVTARLPRPKVAFMWVPQTSGSPAVPGNGPQAYFPGRRYVDWVGADIFSRWANTTAWTKLNWFYSRYAHWPFVIGEYSPWDNDVTGAFVRRLFSWARDHGRTRMLVYYRSVDKQNRFNLQYYPGAQASLRRILDDTGRYLPYAPGTGHRRSGR